MERRILNCLVNDKQNGNLTTNFKTLNLFLSKFSGFRPDPCSGDACGPNAECTRSGDRAVCDCKRGYLGSPYSRSGCRANPCAQGICGAGAECKDVGGRPVCECLPGHQVRNLSFKFKGTVREKYEIYINRVFL